MKIVASSARPSPAEASSTYFHAASAAPSVSSIATSSAETTVVTSIATHSRARLLISGAASIAQANRLSPTQNRREYRAERLSGGTSPAAGVPAADRYPTEYTATAAYRNPVASRNTALSASTRRKPQVGDAAVRGGRDQRQHQAEAGGSADYGHRARRGQRGAQADQRGRERQRQQEQQHDVHWLTPQAGQVGGGHGLGPAVVHPDQQAEDHYRDQQVEQERHLQDQRQPGRDDQRGQRDSVLQ